MLCVLRPESHICGRLLRPAAGSPGRVHASRQRCRAPCRRARPEDQRRRQDRAAGRLRRPREWRRCAGTSPPILNDPGSAAPQGEFYFYDARGGDSAGGNRLCGPSRRRCAGRAVGSAAAHVLGVVRVESAGLRTAVGGTRTTLDSQAFLDYLDSRARPEDDSLTVRFAGADRVRGGGE